VEAMGRQITGTIEPSGILPGEQCTGIAAISKPFVLLALALLLGLLSKQKGLCPRHPGRRDP
jgi:hypothetical protein